MQFHRFDDRVDLQQIVVSSLEGSPLGQKVYDAVQGLKDGQITSVSYNYPRPNTTNPVPKESYLTRVGNTACGVGYYKP